MPEISIVVPVYNTEAYLRGCIESILAQTFRDFELLLVDDGSTDSSGDICDEYAEKDSRVCVIHQKNAGGSAARNTGIQSASGKYLMFSDNDDCVHPYWCEILYKTIKQNPSTAVSCDILEGEVNKRGGGVEIFNAIFPDIEYSFEKPLETDYYTLFKRGVTAFVFNKIYEMRIIREYNILFDEEYIVVEDTQFNTAYLKYCRKNIHIPLPLYFHTIQNQSMTHSYHREGMWYSLHSFYWRTPYIGEEHMGEYCDGWLYTFLQEFATVFDKRNKQSFFSKMRYNQKMMRTEQFTFCVQNATGEKESPKVMKLLRKQNYYLWWAFQKLAYIKNR